MLSESSCLRILSAPDSCCQQSRPGPSVVVGDGISRKSFSGKYALSSTVHLPDSFLRYSCVESENHIVTDVSRDCGCRGHIVHSTKGISEPRDGNGVYAYYQNVRGLRTKVDDLFLAANDCNYDIIMLTETGLDGCIDSLQLFGSGFNVYRCDRSSIKSQKSSFGGVLIAVA